MKNKKDIKKIEIYQAKNGAIELSVDAKKETIWATQQQIADIFSVERSVITKHINNILKDNELDKKSVCAKFAHTASDGKIYQVQFYNLDILLSVGYRTNSQKAIIFRKWATKTLKQHITEGYTINKNILAKNYETFLRAVEETKKLLPEDGRISAQDTMELIKLFAGTWFSLDAYDRESLPIKGATRKKVDFAGQELVKSIGKLKTDLLRKKEATDIFATERGKGGLAGIVGNVLQSFGGKDLYPTIEEKAVHLLYFIVKNHPFVDGNKRSGAFAFIWFLQRARFNFRDKITPEALTVITLFIAESKPKDKDRMIGLVLLLLKK